MRSPVEEQAQRPHAPMSNWTHDPLERARFLDGECPADEAAARARDLLTDPEARARLERHRALLAAIAKGRDARPSPSDLLAPRVRGALATDRAKGFPSTGAGDSLPRVGRSIAIASAAAAVLAAVFVFARGGETPVTAASDRGVYLAAQAFRDGLGANATSRPGGTCEEGVASPHRFPLVENGELSLSKCTSARGDESVSLVERTGDPKGRRGLVVVPWDGKSSATDVGFTFVGDVVVFDVRYGRAKYYLAARADSVVGTTSCAVCHGPERAKNETRNPHKIFERPLGVVSTGTSQPDTRTPATPGPAAK